MARILLLEPNHLVAEQYKTFLEKKGYSVVCCQNAQAGILAADKAVPDLVLIELQLAGHSGVEFLYEFRTYPEWSKIPAIILTSLPSNDNVIPELKLQQLGVITRLYKADISLDKLGRVLDRALKAKLSP